MPWALVSIASIVAGLILVSPIVRAVVHAIERRAEGAQAAGAAPEDLAELRAGVEELRDLSARVLELEERVDFAERMLARERESAALPAAASLHKEA